MHSFGLYSQYYDLFYQDKDYSAEADYVCSLLQRYSLLDPRSILELGSGTGIHAELMGRRGYSVHGVEVSATMLAVAKRRELICDDAVQFFQGDARSYRAGRRFDAVLSLFHVLSYQVSSEDIQGLLATAAAHLNVGGVFVFDFWYGPAVLWQRPSLRVKRLENQLVSMIRIAEPEIYEADNLVSVNYTIFVQDRGDDVIKKLQENHRMRYFFLREIKYYLERAGFALRVAEEWLTGALPSTETWGVLVVAEKIR
jgi:SAM-dependent methyltransferase